MTYIVRINDKEYEVKVERGQATLVRTSDVAAAPAPAVPAAQNPAPAPAAAAPVSAAGVEVIKAPMPGTVLDLKAAPGQAVKKGELLLILEAMKMENEIMAPADGVVAQIHVSKGASVSTGDALISMR